MGIYYVDESLIIDGFGVRRVLLANNKIIYHMPTLYKVMEITDLEKFKELFIDTDELGTNTINGDYIDSINLNLLVHHVNPNRMHLFTKLLNISKN